MIHYGFEIRFFLLLDELPCKANELRLPGFEIRVFLLLDELPYKANELRLPGFEIRVFLPRDMSYLFLPHLPRMVAMFAKFFVFDRKVSNLMYYFFLLYLLITKVNNTKCQKRDQLQPDGCKLFVILFSLCVKDK